MRCTIMNCKCYSARPKHFMCAFFATCISLNFSVTVGVWIFAYIWNITRVPATWNIQHVPNIVSAHYLRGPQTAMNCTRKVSFATVDEFPTAVVISSCFQTFCRTSLMASSVIILNGFRRNWCSSGSCRVENVFNLLQMILGLGNRPNQWKCNVTLKNRNYKACRCNKLIYKQIIKGKTSKLVLDLSKENITQFSAV